MWASSVAGATATGEWIDNVVGGFGANYEVSQILSFPSLGVIYFGVVNEITKFEEVAVYNFTHLDFLHYLQYTYRIGTIEITDSTAVVPIPPPPLPSSSQRAFCFAPHFVSVCVRLRADICAFSSHHQIDHVRWSCCNLHGGACTVSIVTDSKTSSQKAQEELFASADAARIRRL
jgi:hypothetical protein